MQEVSELHRRMTIKSENNIIEKRALKVKERKKPLGLIPKNLEKSY